AWSACPPVMVTVTGGLEVIGTPLLKLSALTVAVLVSTTWQVSKFGPSAKSDSVADGLWEERVSARKLVKQGLRPSEVRLTPTSRNSPWSGWVCPLLLT